MATRIYTIAAVLAGLVAGAGTAAAQEARLGSGTAQLSPATVASPVTLFVNGPLTIGSVTPSFGALAVGLTPDAPNVTAPLLGVTPLMSPDFTASYSADVIGSQIGVFAGYSGGASLFSAAPTPGWNFGASVGYRGFYVQAGISDNSGAQQRLTGDPKQGWLAGFGYKTGAFNVRLSYMTAQSLNAGESDARTWMIGGIYQLSARVRLNADAFTGRDPARDPRNAVTPAAAVNAAAPQGTGARVGVQLRF
jgi:hypothetical protein